jgi:glycosyltransferase involved in cell wall biosynthesis
MKIGIIFLKRRGPGGAISYELATQLQARADVFAVVSSYAENVSVWRAGPVPMIEVPTFETPAQAIGSSLDLRRQQKMIEQIKRENPDVLFFPMLHWWAPIIQARLGSVPNVVMIHDPEPHPGILGQAEWQFERFCARRATRCVVLSEVFVPTLERAGVARQKVDVIPLGALLSYYSSQSRREPTSASGELTILFFGRIAPYKGLEVLLRAFEQIERVSEARLLIVGAGNLEPYKQQLAKLTRVRIVNEWVPDEQVEFYFHQAQIVVAPYTSATQSGVVSIAASMGIPVIASRTGGIAEQIEHGRTGILVEPGSAEDLAKGCLRLINDRAFADALAEQAKIVARNAFGWDTIAQKVVASCERAIESKRRDR